RQAAAVDREVEEEARLLLGLNLLDQGDLAGQSGSAGVAGALHGGAAARVGEHVIAEGGPVAAVQRLEEEDGMDLGPRAVRPDPEIGKPLPAHGGDQRLHLRGSAAAAEADPLEPRIALPQLQLGDERPERLAMDRLLDLE